VKEFPARAQELQLLLSALRDDWTDAEAKLLAKGIARDQLDVQEQGEVLGRLQTVAFFRIKAEDCRPTTTPDPGACEGKRCPDRPNGRPWSFTALVDIGTIGLSSLLVLALIIAHGIWRQQRALQRRATWAAEEFDEARAAGSVIKRMDTLWSEEQELSSPVIPSKARMDD
jgi:hypothetical protein